MTDYLTNERLSTALAAVVLLVIGWLFTILIDAQLYARDRDDEQNERLSRIEGMLEACATQ